uniref:Uncharacterized protein n=1 Tax=Dunaliella tertiolecta TaxID=3047 RepID=A0A7S3QUF6_DUNTE|mmetsp:Transcript_21525/g.59635  ORF Transcript_21525/g.59635 Transcript_21525/m.59635 type:complete len:312 (-) Transcript_21525:401-1336(-)|eukprot:CAMPEP_0202389352 /NCGR_PEP_ID=MMETSP1127-20130417/82435_1 /ASSEMBLY_ACC=CAM_ASM_000462 /TAXON_ID=3047 /ORGANISM="Dunaliella tertiolecta, Strain CCMP1320" /LENGTH=311 /DNA_ID=CAMNT_0048991075 /DNA_START=65 /DNA_END=1000 /DNA_ORIENTATION=+
MGNSALPTLLGSWLLVSALSLGAGFVIGKRQRKGSAPPSPVPPPSPFSQTRENSIKPARPKLRRKPPKPPQLRPPFFNTYILPLLPVIGVVLLLVLAITLIAFIREDRNVFYSDLACGFLMACALLLGNKARHKGRGLQRQLSQKPPPSIHYHPILGMNGVWFKAPECESKESVYESRRACDLLQLNGIVRVAVCLIKGVEFKIHGGVGDENSTFEMAAFSVIHWFKVKERWPMSGKPVLSNRRDLRRGKMTGSCKIVDGSAVELNMWWGEPFAGRGRDFFRLVSHDELHVTTTLWVANEEHTYTTIHRRG